MNKKIFHVTKASGELEEFSLEKYKKSLKRAKLSDSNILEILNEIQPKLYEGISTQELYNLTHDQILKRSTRCASLYSLKDAIRKLGPTGFPFEQLVSGMLEFQGYSVLTDQILEGKCVSHEVDLLAHKESEYLFLEAKFHTQIGYKTTVKTVLYVKARYDDLKYNKKNNLTDCLLITNAKFTSQAIAYAKCENIRLIAWGYPPHQGIDHLINKCILYPITTLAFLSNADKDKLLNANIILCKDLVKDLKKVISLGIKPQVAEKLKIECLKLIQE